MAIYTCITYQACCDGCGKEYGMFSSVGEARQAVESDKDWKVIDGNAYCPKCAVNPPKPLSEKDIEKLENIIQQYFESKEQRNGSQD